MNSFNHDTEPLENGRHPKYGHLCLFEIEPYMGSYLLTAHGQNGSALISNDDAVHMFENQFEQGYAYLVDDYLEHLN